MDPLELAVLYIHRSLGVPDIVHNKGPVAGSKLFALTGQRVPETIDLSNPEQGYPKVIGAGGVIVEELAAMVVNGNLDALLGEVPGARDAGYLAEELRRAVERRKDPAASDVGIGHIDKMSAAAINALVTYVKAQPFLTSDT